MTERPIPMTGPSVVATMAKIKTQTRRVIRHQADGYRHLAGQPDMADGWYAQHFDVASGWQPDRLVRCPYGVPGDRLYVKERFRRIGRCPDSPEEFARARIEYAADGSIMDRLIPESHWDKPTSFPVACGPSDRYHSGRFMPKWAARNWLEIVEEPEPQRLQDISEADCLAEGCKLPDGYVALMVSAFREEFRQIYVDLWDSINGRRYPWAGNWWVWPIEYKVLSTTGRPKEIAND